MEHLRRRGWDLARSIQVAQGLYKNSNECYQGLRVGSRGVEGCRDMRRGIYGDTLCCPYFVGGGRCLRALRSLSRLI